MLFLSTLHNAPVYDSALKKIGTLKDIIVGQAPNLHAPIKAVLINRHRTHGEIFVPWITVENIARDSVTLTTIDAKLTAYSEQPEDIRLCATVLDHQIIDINGARVVRVNDLQLGVVDGKMCAVGIDVSVKGIMRRLRIDSLDVFGFFAVKLIDWRQAKFVSGRVQVGSLSKEVVHMHPADLANIIEELNIKQGSEVIKSLDLATAARVFEEIDTETQRILITALGPERVAQLTAQMPIDELVDLLKSLPLATKEELVAHLQAAKATSARILMEYPDRSAGGLMTTDFIYCNINHTVQDAIEQIRKRTLNFRSVHYVYVVDEVGVFRGVISIRRLLLNDPTTPVTVIMRDRKRLKVLRPRHTLREIATIMTKYHLFSIAVLDKEKKVIGIVTIDDVMRALFPYA